MPVKDMEAIKMPQGARASSRCQFDRGESDFLRRPGRNVRSKRLSHELRTETNAECWAQETKAVGDQSGFYPQKGIGIIFIDANRPAQHDEKIGTCDLRWLKTIHADINASRFEPAMLKN
jgi:hypothetical protein